MEPSKVVAAIVPPDHEHRQARADYEEVWREMVQIKARLANVANEIVLLQDQMAEHRRSMTRHVKRLDAVASRLATAQAKLGA